MRYRETNVADQCRDKHPATKRLPEYDHVHCELNKEHHGKHAGTTEKVGPNGKTSIEFWEWQNVRDPNL